MKNNRIIAKTIILLVNTVLHCYSKDYDYIVVGAGTGGGTVATELAMKGYSTLLIEAGPDYYEFNNTVPLFSARASEDPRVSFGFDVKHYDNDTQTYFYPRVGGLGGCSIHNAMITVYPNTRDFQLMQSITGDVDGWSEANMRKYFKRMENNQYINSFLPPITVLDPVVTQVNSILSSLGIATNTLSSALGLNNVLPAIGQLNSHGFGGWFSTSYINYVRQLKLDAKLVNLIALVLGNPVQDVNGYNALTGKPNTDYPGKIFVPQAVDTKQYTRVNYPAYLKSIANSYPLDIWTNTFVTRVLFDSSNVAVGVEYRKGQYLYKASPLSSDANRASAVLSQVMAKREIILSGGAFNTPQLLMLSGVGPRDQLAQFNIPLAADLPGVGRNLMDRYEIPLVTQYTEKFALVNNCQFNQSMSDPCFANYINAQSGPYISDGVIAGELIRSSPNLTEPDIFALNVPSDFHGYYRGYSTDFSRNTDCSTRLLLKAHTSNTNGQVSLNSADPFDMPSINFRSFSDGDGDLNILIQGIKDARTFMRGMVVQHTEKLPGPDVQTDDQIRQYIKNLAWGHHASCTAKMGTDTDPLAVLDGRFRVRQVKNLRVVDASAFPKIPGYFPALYIHMMAMKAADYIAQDAGTLSN